MDTNNYDVDEISRLAGLFIERNPSLADMGIDGYNEAVKNLQELKIILICGQSVGSSAALQAALITAVNTGKRCFQGGVTVFIKESMPFLLPNKQPTTLNAILMALDAKVVNKIIESDYSFCLTFGERAKEQESAEVVCNGWVGGICNSREPISINSEPDFALGGIFAGSLGIAHAFLKVSGEKPDACSSNIGLSLWRPDLNWQNEDAIGPEVKFLPQKYWLVGLGHLGQAFVWTLGLLPFKDFSRVIVSLQDDERVSKSNFDTGMLSEMSNVNKKKTRVCSEWLERLGISTNIIERKFDKTFDRHHEEPGVLIRGLDTTKSRKEINFNNFLHVIDCGIGGTRSDFDNIAIYNFPECKKRPEEIWEDGDGNVINAANEKAMNFLGCGKYGKAISTSFVGALASTLVFSELIRAGFQGVKSSTISVSIRNIQSDSYFGLKGNYSDELASNGFV